MFEVDTVSAATTARDDVDELPASEASSYPPKEGRGHASQHCCTARCPLGGFFEQQRKVAYPDSSWYEGAKLGIVFSWRM